MEKLTSQFLQPPPAEAAATVMRFYSVFMKFFLSAAGKKNQNHMLLWRNEIVTMENLTRNAKI